jgi:predicted ATPase
MDTDVIVTPCVHLDPFSSHSTSQLGALWDAIALTETEQEIVEALRVISSDILAISMIGSNTTRPRIAIVKSSRFPQPVSLRTFGDGLNRLFGIVLSLCNARNGVLLVDEIEIGLHYSVQVSIWRIIFSLAKKLNVQVFATSHSWDCVRAFQEAAKESPEEGVLIRLSKRGENVIPTLFYEHELAIATRDQIEVR